MRQDPLYLLLYLLVFVAVVVVILWLIGLAR